MMLVYDSKTSATYKTDIRRPAEHEVAWIRLQAPEEDELKRVLTDFQCHPLLIEDCIKMNQRPKLDRYRNNFLITFFSLSKNLQMNEIAIVIGKGYVLTVCKEEPAFLSALENEFLSIEGRMEHEGDILHRILDCCVDEYVEAANHLEDQLDRIERHILRNPYIRVAEEIYQHKRSIHKIRRILTEERVVLGAISHPNFPFTRPETDVYFADILDHLSRVIDSVDTTRENLNGLLELQTNLKSDRMNEIMKRLTIVSSIFLPLTFIVGVYGMNFEWMPELEWKYGYPVLVAVMLVIAGVLRIYYKLKKWL